MGDGVPQALARHYGFTSVVGNLEDHLRIHSYGDRLITASHPPGTRTRKNHPPRPVRRQNAFNSSCSFAFAFLALSWPAVLLQGLRGLETWSSAPVPSPPAVLD
jgi:hypothetical protein